MRPVVRMPFFYILHGLRFVFRFPRPPPFIFAPHFFHSIPTEFGLLTATSWLSLASSSLIGGIPSQIALMSQLTLLDVSGNPSLGQALPSQLYSLTRLISLDIHGTGVSGTVSSLVAQLSALTYLDLSSTQLSGSLPGLLFNCTRLLSLRIGGSPSLGGTLPSSIGLLSKLTSLSITASGISGLLPTELALLTSLTSLDLHGNSFVATIPAALAVLKSLVFFSVANNTLLCGARPSLPINVTAAGTLLGGACPSPPPPPPPPPTAAASLSAMASIKAAWFPSNQVLLRSWGAGTDPCSGYYGVLCGVGVVTGLAITGAGLSGTLPTERKWTQIPPFVAPSHARSLRPSFLFDPRNVELIPAYVSIF